MKALAFKLMESSANQPAADLEAVFRENHAMVFRAAYRITGNANDAEDVLQTVFLRLLKREPSSEPIENMVSFLHRAAVNAALDLVRPRLRGHPGMAARGPGPAEPADRPDVHPAVLRRKGQPRDRAHSEHHAGDGGGDHLQDPRPLAAGIPFVRGRRSMIPEMNPMDPELERAVSEIRDEPIDPAVVEAAAGRVWERLAAQVQNDLPDTHIRSCADFQALIPEYRAGRLPEARALLLKDHLHQCVACRRFSEGKVVAFPAPHLAKSPSRPRYAVRWTAAAMAVAAAGAFAWVAIDRYGTRSGRAYIQALNGAIYEISATGVRPMAAGQDLPDGVAIRTAKDSYATVQLRDGSTVEVRERSEFSTSESGKDLTVHLNRGDLIFQAAKRRAGHLYVATADCRVAVTGTVFSVNAGVKGSRVSVVQGEVHVAQDNQDKLLRPGDQSVSGTNLSPAPIQYDMAWSRDTQRFAALEKAVPAGAVSPLLNRIPATAVFVALIPNAGTSLNDALTPLRQQAAQNPQLRAMLAGRGLEIQSVLGKLQAAGEYLDQLAIVGLAEA
ncbi:MAG: FecR domain-containing protein, partial [Acidobacteriia bacterium]|nr:FecR domain-containing protein [Terriglobia bacterium]